MNEQNKETGDKDNEQRNLLGAAHFCRINRLRAYRLYFVNCSDKQAQKNQPNLIVI